MRNVMLHAVVRGVPSPAGLARLVVAGHAFGMGRLAVRVEGPSGRLEAFADVHPRTHQWVAVFEDAGALRAAGVAAGARVRAVAADADDPDGCYSSAEARVEVD